MGGGGGGHGGGAWRGMGTVITVWQPELPSPLIVTTITMVTVNVYLLNSGEYSCDRALQSLGNP